MTADNAEAWGRYWRRAARRWDTLAKEIAGASGWQVWNPGRYGERWHKVFRRIYPPGRRPLMVFGLNPGPYGMAQTGIPFTDVKRIHSHLPRLAAVLTGSRGGCQVPALAPPDLQRFFTRTFESSSVRVYRFLEEAYGTAEAGTRQVVVANPCPLLFIDPEEGRNRTPADLSRAAGVRVSKARRAELLAEVERLRRLNATDAVDTLAPRGCILLGKNAQAAMGETLQEAIGDADRIVDWEHPARAVPATWSGGLQAELRRRKLLTATT